MKKTAAHETNRQQKQTKNSSPAVPQNGSTRKQGTLLSFFSKTPTNSPQVSSPFSSPLQLTPQSKILNNTVVCPVCNQNVQKFKINQHLDANCSSFTVTAPNPSLDAAGSTATIKLEEDEILIIEEKTMSLPAPAQSCQTDTLAETKKAEIEEKNVTESSLSQESFLQAKNSNSQPFKTPRKNTLVRSKSANDLRTSNQASTPHRLSKTSPKKASRFSPRRYLNSSTSFGSSQASKPDESIKRNLFPSPKKNISSSQPASSSQNEKTPEKRYFGLPYYLENFQSIVLSIRDDPHYAHLFDEKDQEHMGNFCNSSVDAQKLYVRLFQRKFAWHRSERIEYTEIAPVLEPFLKELVNMGFLHDVSALSDLEETLDLLTAPELKQLCKELKLTSALSKELSAQTILDFCKQHKKNYFSAKSSCDITLRKAKSLVGNCYKLHEGPRRTFLRKLMLHSLPQQSEEDEERGQHQPLLTLLMVNLGRMTYPAYRIIKERQIFPTQARLIMYEEAAHLDNQVRDAVESNKWQLVGQLTDGVLEKFLEMLQNEEITQHDLSLPLFLRKFTPGSAYTYCLSKRVEALQRDRNYTQAVELLKQLLAQKTYLPYYRGHWYERLALNFDQHLKDKNQAFQALFDGLQDDYVSPSHKLALSIRARKWLKSKQYEAWVTQVQTLALASPSDAPTVTIQGRSLPRDSPGYKMSFIRGDSNLTSSVGDMTICSVEELVIGHYESLGFSEGIHGEGSTFVTLLGLFFWDIVYEIPLSDVFLSPHQTVPLDMTSPEFYANRKFFIEERIKEIRNWSVEEGVAFIRKIWDQHNGTVSLVNWDRFRSFEHVEALVQCVGMSVLAGIFCRLLRNFRQFRSGFPDLTVWNPAEKKYRIVEVKGPNDRLSTKQIVWLDYLISIGAQAEVCYVEAIGAKRIAPVTPAIVKENIPQPKKQDRKKVEPAGEVENADSDFLPSPRPKKNRRSTRSSARNTDSTPDDNVPSTEDEPSSPKRKRKRTASKRPL